MTRVISVKFRNGGKSYFFDPGELEIHDGDGVIVETARGIEFADVVGDVQEIDESKIVAPLKGVIRIATDYDRSLRDTNRAKEKDAFDICVDKIAEHGLDMKLVDVEYSYNGSKVMFYFTADGRVDFRELVKDLAGVFRTRIELRQIGVRDEAKMLGGLGSCGRPVCCKAFLSDFAPVSIKMAKEQSLSLSPSKISGICGRLMCCLKYEQDCYETMRKQMPRPGRDVRTPDGDGTVLENNVITEKTRVRVTLADGTFDVRDYPFRELILLNSRHPELVENDEDEVTLNDDADVIADEDELLITEEKPQQSVPRPQFEQRKRTKPQRVRPQRTADATEGADDDVTVADEYEADSAPRRERRKPRYQRRRPRDNRARQNDNE